MAYLIFSKDGLELGRWPLNGPTVVGRSPECDVCVHDIQLSRRHCRLQPAGGQWTVLDLNSRNGTRVNGDPADRRPLRDGDELALGKVTARFHAGRMPEGGPPARGGRIGARPKDPFEALANTVSDYDPEAALAYQRQLNLPTPRPRPREPAAYFREDLHGLLSEIASSSWDSIYAGMSRPRMPELAAPVAIARQRVRRPARPHQDVSLHVHPRVHAAPQKPAEAPAITPVTLAAQASPKTTWFNRAMRPAAKCFRAAWYWLAL